MLSNLKHPNKDANFPRNDILHVCVFEIQTIDPRNDGDFNEVYVRRRIYSLYGILYTYAYIRPQLIE